MRILKFAIYAALTVIGIAIAYQRVAPVLREGAVDAAGWVSLGAWAALGLYLAGYAFLLAAEAIQDRRHRLTFDVAAFVVFCTVFAGRLLGM